MKIKRLVIKNFMAIGEADVTLNDRGLVLIQGINEDDTSQKSNGSGKSSIADGLSWCLYGTTAREEAGDKVVNRTAGKDCMVSVVFDNDVSGDTYVVQRFRKHHKHKNRLILTKIASTGAHDLTLGTDKLTQDLVNRLLGCSVEVFNAAIYAGQERMPSLPAMTDKELKQIVEEAAGIDILQECYVRAQAECSDAKREVEAVENQIDKAKTLLAHVNGTVADLSKKSAEWTDEWTKRGGVLTAQVAKLKEHCKALKAVEARAEKDAHEAAVIGGGIREKLKGRKEAEAKLSALQAEVGALTRSVAVKQTQAHAAGVKAKQAKAALDGVSSRVGVPCGECAKPYEEHDLDGARECAKKRLADAVREYRALKEGFDIAFEERERKQAEFEYEKSKLPDVSALTAELDRCTEVIDKWKSAKAATAVAMSNYEAAVREAERHTVETNPFVHLLAKEIVRVKDVEGLIDTLKTKLQAVKDSLDIAKATAEIYSPAGVRAHILDHVTPFLNARTSHYLSGLSDGNIAAVWNTLSTTAKGDLREKFTIEVSSKTGGDTFGLLSGGEKRKVRLACAMALQDVVAERALHPIKLFIADEIDDALDEAGLERLMTLLDEKAREKGTVLVISHHSLSDWIREQITVTKKGGLATIS